jgi:LacI family transcriptional regulator, galactose operon repressor
MENAPKPQGFVTLITSCRYRGILYAGFMGQKPTIRTVARRAGVAVSTVSRYFNGHYVSQKVRDRLAGIIDELGYTRSTTARNLSLGKKGCIGVVVDSTQDPWFTQLLVGIEEELSVRETSLMLASLELRGAYDPGIVFKWIREDRLDGLILAKSQKRDQPLVQTALQAGVPVSMVVPYRPFANVQILTCDNSAAGAIVADHLADLGHKRVAFAGGPRDSIDTGERLRGLREGLMCRGISMEESDIAYCGSYEAEAGVRWAEAFLGSPLRVTAVVMGNDALALGLMRVAWQRGIRIPEQLSLVGFDNIPECALVWPGLTTMAQPMRKLGQAACRSLFDRVASPGSRDAIVHEMKLVKRESSGPAPELLTVSRTRTARKRPPERPGI